MTATLMTAGGLLMKTGTSLVVSGPQYIIPTTGITWPTAPNITWAWATTTSSSLATVTNPITNATHQAQIIAGIAMWSAVCGVKITQVGSPGAANIQIGWADCGSLGLIGEALWNFSGSLYNFALVILEDPVLSALTTDGNGLLAYSNNVELKQLACHEFGATLGLAEGNVDPNSIMNHLQTSQNRVPDASDAAAMQGLYGPP